MARRARSVVVVLAAALGCGDDRQPEVPDAGAPTRVIAADLEVDGAGTSEALAFTVPERTRSVTVVIEGSEAALYGLAELTTADGIDHVRLPAGPPGPAMRASYLDEQIGQMPGELYQSVRLGTFTHVYPYRPDQELPAGPSSLRVASDTAGPVRVKVLLPEDDGGRTLHLNLAVVSDTIAIADPPAFADELAALFAGTDIDLAIDRVLRLPDTGLEAITGFSEPQERPDSMAASLPGLVSSALAGPGLDVFVVERLPPGVGGLSLGTPGPPLRGSYYYGVVVLAQVEPAAAARVVAHEVAHFLGLQHVENRGISGAIYPDPLDDTRPGAGNLMEDGTTLTPDQAWSLRRSALLQLE